MGWRINQENGKKEGVEIMNDPEKPTKEMKYEHKE